MIIREWKGRASPTRSAEYPEHFRRAVIPELKSVPGFLGAFLSARSADGVMEFVVLTRWTSMDAVRAFAGSDPEKAVVEPGAIAALTDYDSHVRHYEVIENI